jgi:hypothetical protein
MSVTPAVVFGPKAFDPVMCTLMRLRRNNHFSFARRIFRGSLLCSGFDSLEMDNRKSA